jgi:hypothetical protein
MKTVCALGFGVVLMSLTVADAAPAQDAIEPASSVRVVEARSRFSGQLVRQVVEDLERGQLVRQVVEDLEPAEILRVQVELGRAGFDPKFRNGIVNTATRRALRRFQIARGLRICSCVSYETVIALGIRPQLLLDGESAIVYNHRRDDGLVVVVPGFALGHHHGIKHRHFSGVVVGHEPVLGAGQAKEIFPRSSVAQREQRAAPSRSRRPSKIRPARGR